MARSRACRPAARTRPACSPPGSASCSPPAAAVVALWFLQKIVTAILLLFFAIVVAIALSAPVEWFVRRGLPRRLAGDRSPCCSSSATIALLGWAGHPAAGAADRAAGQPAARFRRPLRRPARRPARHAIRTCRSSSASSGAGASALAPDAGRALPRPRRLLAVAARRARADHHLLLDRRLYRARSAADPARLSRQPAARLSAGRDARLSPRQPGGDRLDQGEPGDRRDPGGGGRSSS